MLWLTHKFNPNTELMDLKGKIIIVTGANSGIGFSTAAYLARAGAKVYLGARAADKGQAAIVRLAKEGGVAPGEVAWLSCDLGTPQSAKKAAEEFFKKEQRLDILVNNAAHTAVHDPPEKLKEDVIPDSMLVNHIGTFVFTLTLLPLLAKTAAEPGSDVRIVTVASDGHRLSRAADPNITFNSVEDLKRKYEGDRFAGFSRYVVSKLANILFATHLQRLLDSPPTPNPSTSNIISLSVHPGTVNTFSDKLPLPLPSSWKHFLLGLMAKGVDEGSWNSCWAAASPIVREENEEKYKGAYLTPIGKITVPGANAQKRELGDAIWKVTEEYLWGEGVEIPDIGTSL